jgi:hypothetical protein
LANSEANRLLEYRFQPREHFGPSVLHAFEARPTNWRIDVEAFMCEPEASTVPLRDQLPGDDRIENAVGETVLKKPLMFDLKYKVFGYRILRTTKEKFSAEVSI